MSIQFTPKPTAPHADAMTALTIGHYRFSTTHRMEHIVFEIERHFDSPIYREKVPIYMTPRQGRQLIGLLEATLVHAPAPDSQAGRVKRYAANLRALFGLQPHDEARS